MLLLEHRELLESLSLPLQANAQFLFFLQHVELSQALLQMLVQLSNLFVA